MSDSDIIEAIRAGDQGAFAVFIERYRPLVQGLCHRIAGNNRDADELAHDTFVEAYLKIDTLRDSTRLPGWLRTLTLNHCRMWIRDRKHHCFDLPDDLAAKDVDPGDDDPSLVARMAGALTQLPASQRLVLVLHYFENLSYEQIAEFLDIPPGTVMSRLHRARGAVRQILETFTPDEEPPMYDDERFKQQIQAEIHVLLEMFREEPSAAQRLSVILRHSPQHLEQLIRQAEHDETLEDLAILLPRLGAAGFAVVLDVALADEPRLAERAGGMLREVIRRCRSVDTGGWQAGTPWPDAYMLMQAITAHSAAPGAKAELLIDLLDVCQDGAVAALLSCMLLCYWQQAIPLLLEWFHARTGPEQLHAPSYLLFALCRTGTHFCGELVTLLEQADPQRQLLALEGLEAVGRCFDDRWMTRTTPEEVADGIRTRAKWPSLRHSDIDSDIYAKIQDRTAGLLTSPRADLRSGALAVLGYFQAHAHLDRIADLTTQEDPTTRLAAVRALAQIGDAGAEALMHVALHGQPAERRAAIDAIGRHRMKPAQPLLLGLLADGNPQVQQAAVTALGQMGTDEANAALRDLLASADRRLQKAAAKAMYRPPRERQAPRPGKASVSVAARMRSGARPIAYSAVHVVLRSALPDLRPYDEQELTRRIAAVCIDYSLTRRRLVDEGWMTREAGVYELTDSGRAAWQVEQFILMHYLH